MLHSRQDGSLGITNVPMFARHLNISRRVVVSSCDFSLLSSDYSEFCNAPFEIIVYAAQLKIEEADSLIAGIKSYEFVVAYVL